MARSCYIYLVCLADTSEFGMPIAAFTVKHEMRTWLSRERIRVHGTSLMYLVYRMPDGVSSLKGIPQIMEGE